MKKSYISPEWSLISLDADDVIVTSLAQPFALDQDDWVIIE